MLHEIKQRVVVLAAFDHRVEIDRQSGPARSFDAAPALAKALEDGTLDIFLEGLPPPHREYRNLAAALARYRALEESGGWRPVPARGADSQALAQRLAPEDPILAELLFPTEDEVREAVVRFHAPPADLARFFTTFYLHDTPGKDVFLPATRQKSNGCIRVEDMSALSALMLADDGQKDLEALAQAVSSGETERLTLAKPVPVYLLYWTAIADEDGNVGFRSDFYSRDKPLLAALGGQRRNSGLVAQR